ncbi:MAG: hypothetical protein A4E69_01539 [Syntrophus sp. PtaB.Bin138]|jgi:hypothetical protein|nr:MAG: hypothetical protein A4E69_01539 [Syntrophus sp. PtaB.Bin138]
MTCGDVFVQIVHEVTGLGKEYLDSLLREALTAFPGRISHDQEVTDNEALTMLSALRKERNHILAWCYRAGLKVPESRPGNA